MSSTLTQTQNVGTVPIDNPGNEAAPDPTARTEPSPLFLKSISHRVYTDGVTEAFEQSWPSYLLAVTTLTLYVGWVYVLYIWMFASFFNRYAATALGFAMLTVLFPAKLYWSEFLDNRVFRSWREYFRYSFVFEEVLEFNKSYIFAEYPHGIFPMSQILAATLANQVWPGHRIYNIAADVLFWIPLWKHIMMWIGSQPATAQNFKRLLQRGSVAVVCGGIAEMYMQHPTQEQILLRKRKGFVRVAVEHGVDIIPVYHFGNTQLLTGGPKWVEKYARKLRMSLGYMYGRWCLPLARQRPLLMVCGRKVAVNKLPRHHPSFAQEVDKVHEEVVKEMERLYDAWKGEYGWQDRPLVIY